MSDPQHASANPVMRSATAGLVTAAGLLVGTGLIVRQLLPPARLLASLAWFDVFAVHVASALPLAWWLGIWSAALRPFDRVGIAAGLALASAALAVSSTSVAGDSPAIECVDLTVMMLCAATVFTLLPGGWSSQRLPVPWSWMTVLSLALLALIVPLTYLHARLRHEQTQVSGLLDQSRFGEALEAIGPIARVAPDSLINGRPARQVQETLQAGVRSLQIQVERPLPVIAPEPVVLARAQTLAVLGRTDEALSVLERCRDETVDRWLLEGAIHENRQEWNAGTRAYREAATLLLTQPASDTRTARQIQAYKGIGFCERKRGRTREAEAAYRQLLEISPSADAHFLAAQFYEDIQFTTQALEQARQAMAIDPVRFTERGRELIARLQTVHFGCWGVYRATLKIP